MNTEDRKEAYFNWLLTPASEREHGTKKAFAEALGISRTALYDYERDPRFQAKIKEAKSVFTARWYVDIMHSMKDIVDNGQHRDRIQAARVLLAHLDLDKEEQIDTKLTKDEIQRLEDALAALKTQSGHE